MKHSFLPAFLVSLGIVLLIIFLGWFGFLKGLQDTIAVSFFSLDNVFSSKQSSSELDTLKKEIVVLQTQLAKDQIAMNDNTALRDQFHSTVLPSTFLLPGRIVGKSGLASQDFFIVDKGEKNSVGAGMVVVYQDNLVGQIAQTTNYFAKVDTVTNPDISFSAQDLTSHALGVIRGKGNGQILLDNVLLSDTIKNGDLVVTTGNQDIHGKGYPPNLVVGKIVSIEKNPSALFQTAQIQSFLSFSSLYMVFIKVQ